MKKTVTKRLSVLLAVWMLLSALSMSAFAAESAEHEHGEGCGCAAPAAAFCPDGLHMLLSTASSEYTNCGDNHLVKDYLVYSCTRCAYFYKELQRSIYQGHSKVTKTKISIDFNSQMVQYLYECYCGHTETGWEPIPEDNQG